MYYGGGQASTYGVPSQAGDPFAEIYAEEMANKGMPINQQMFYPGMQMGMAPAMQPMGYGMPMMMPAPWGYMGYPPSMPTPSMYSGASGMMMPPYGMMPYGSQAGNMNPMSMSVAKQRSDQVWNEAVNKYERQPHNVRSQTVPPVLVTGNESTWQDSDGPAAASSQAPPFSAAQPNAGPPTDMNTPRVRRRVPSSRGSEYAAPSTYSAEDTKITHGLGPLARAEREISQVKSSKARSSQFRETRSLARTSATRTSSAHAPLIRHELPAQVDLLPAPSARARSKSGVVTKEEEEQRKQILKDALDRASNYEVETKTDKKKQFPLTVRHENERFGGGLKADPSFEQVPFPVTTNPADLRRPIDHDKLNKLYYVAGK